MRPQVYVSLAMYEFFVKRFLLDEQLQSTFWRFCKDILQSQVYVSLSMYEVFVKLFLPDEQLQSTFWRFCKDIYLAITSVCFFDNVWFYSTRWTSSIKQEKVILKSCFIVDGNFLCPYYFNTRICEHVVR